MGARKSEMGTTKSKMGARKSEIGTRKTRWGPEKRDGGTKKYDRNEEKSKLLQECSTLWHIPLLLCKAIFMKGSAQTQIHVGDILPPSNIHCSYHSHYRQNSARWYSHKTQRKAKAPRDFHVVVNRDFHVVVNTINTPGSNVHVRTSFIVQQCKYRL